MIWHDIYGRGGGKIDVHAPDTRQEAFVKGVYSAVDEATVNRLERLRSEECITPTCKLGCCHCCRFFILMNIAEAHTLARHIRRTFTESQINALQARTRRWHEWDNSRPGRYPSSDIVAPAADFSDYDHNCPLLVGGACSVYPVRPVVCRAHFVRSPAALCLAASDPDSTQDAPEVLTTVVAEASAVSGVMKDRIEAAGQDFSRTLMLLPHWLAIEMEWDFAISE